MSEGKFLLVDDKIPILHLFSKVFRSAGYKIRLASNSGEALKVLEQESTSVMFIDLGLELLNGFELWQLIRKDRPDTIIYAITRYGRLLGPREIREAGFDGFFAKSLIVERIKQVVHEPFEKIDQLTNKSRHRAIEHILNIDDDEQVC
jgi:DNA-binding NtrC family response regulator